MGKAKSQSGFAHIAIITIILVVALLGALGYVYWQNFMQTKTTGSSKDNSQKSVAAKIELTEIATDPSLVTNLSIMYPKTWTYNSDTTTYKRYYRSTISSPDGKITVHFDTMIIIPQSGAAGEIVGDATSGLCANPMYNKSIIKDLELSEIPGYTNAKFAKYVYYDPAISDSYGFFAYMIPDNDLAKKAEVGGLACYLLGEDYVTVAEDSESETRISIKLAFNEIKNNDNGHFNLTDINEAMSTDDYNIAKQIVQSLYIK